MYDLIQKSFKNYDENMEFVLSKNLCVTAEDDRVSFARRSEFDDDGEYVYSEAYIFLDTIEARKLREFLNCALPD
jgi:hypothetical protein